MSSNFGEYCGIVGLIGVPDAAIKAYMGLYALQHRGQESAGLVISDGKELIERKGLGLVNQVFGSPETLKDLVGSAAIGHVRYSTTGSTNFANSQPFTINYKRGTITGAHNGNLINARELRRKMEQEGSIFRTSTDTEVILHLLAKSPCRTTAEGIADALSQVKGAYSLVFLTLDSLIAVRDPSGFRPLGITRTPEGGTVVASESCAFDLLDLPMGKTLEPGEMIIADNRGNVESLFPFKPVTPSPCIFEFIYFSRPDSRIFDTNVDKIRRRMGRVLAQEQPAEADIVISVPDSSNTAALGYSRESGIPFEFGLIRNHYIGRTFIQPRQAIRDFGVRIKYNPVRGVLYNKRVVVVDDSIVRGTTSKALVSMLREAGAAEVHMRVASPSIKFPCHYGIDTPTSDQLIASHTSLEDTAKFIGADTLGYLSLEGMMSIEGLPHTTFCTACFNGKYPIELTENPEKDKMLLNKEKCSDTY
ncbi:amidophosphoribosyltransferase [bacterium]|nr:amidophosphoribosyltransferase [bacterium]